MELANTIKTILESSGLREPSVTINEDERRISIFVGEGEWLKRYANDLINSLEHIVKIVIKKENIDWPTVTVDVNNHRKERENLIIELAKAAAQKAMATKSEIALPPMNGYERRLVHKELATRPDLKTESTGEGRERHVVIKIL